MISTLSSLDHGCRKTKLRNSICVLARRFLGLRIDAHGK